MTNNYKKCHKADVAASLAVRTLPCNVMAEDSPRAYRWQHHRPGQEQYHHLLSKKHLLVVALQHATNSNDVFSPTATRRRTQHRAQSIVLLLAGNAVWSRVQLVSCTSFFGSLGSHRMGQKQLGHFLWLPTTDFAVCESQLWPICLDACKQIS
jgi:hypothetical protein